MEYENIELPKPAYIHLRSGPDLLYCPHFSVLVKNMQNAWLMCSGHFPRIFAKFKDFPGELLVFEDSPGVR